MFISIGNDTGFARPCTAAAAKWFIRKRSRAISFITIGGGIGGAIIVPLLGWLITSYGWRYTTMITGAGILVFGLPLVYFMRNSPEEMGLLPDGDTASTGESGDLSGPKEEVDFTIWEALKTRSYWTYVIALLLRASILSSMVIHQIPHLVDIGIDYQVATGILGSMILISIVGRGFFGWIGDIFDKRWLLFIICFLQGLGIFIFIHASSNITRTTSATSNRRAAFAATTTSTRPTTAA